MNKQNEEIEIDLLELVRVLWSRIWMIILVTALGLGMAAGYTMLFIKPLYKSTSIMYVLSRQDSIVSLSDLQIGTQMTQDYMVVITSRPVLQQVIDNLGLDMSYGALKQSVSVSNPSNTRFLEITVTSTDAYLAKKIVDEVTEVSADRMAEVIETQRPNIMDYGQIAGGPSSPNLIKNSMIGAMLGFVLICGIIVVLYLLNDTIKTTDDIERYLGLNTLGLIPMEEGVSKKKTHGRDATRRRHHHRSKAS